MSLAATAAVLVGTPVEVSLPSTAARTAVTVPRDALVIRQNHSYVLRVTRANTVEQLDVMPGSAWPIRRGARVRSRPAIAW